MTHFKAYLSLAVMMFIGWTLVFAAIFVSVCLTVSCLQ